MPPKHDLRGGRASANSFVISSSVFIASMKHRFVVTEVHELADLIIVGSHTRTWPDLFPTRRLA